MTRRRGFTLIELLVVIAIIGILAAMLFPVFARARESARKTQCLANVKNIAIAFNMYLTDYDRFMPKEHDSYMTGDFKSSHPGGGSGNGSCPTGANPYLRVPVILDDYTKNRDIWKCPAAKLSTTVRWVVPGYTSPWYQYLLDHQGEWGRADSTNCAGGVCCVAWPPGWGGSVTDSIGQQLMASEGGGAQQFGIGVSQVQDLATSAIDDSAWYVVCADSGSQMDIWMASQVVMPEACRSGCGPADPAAGCCSADWTNCSDSQACGIPWDWKKALFTNPEHMKRFARHLGGSNLGFADGHAKWMPAGTILSESPTYDDNNAGHLRGIGCVIPSCG